MTAAHSHPTRADTFFASHKNNLIYWLIINNPQPNFHSGDTCLGLEGVPWIEVFLGQLQINYNKQASNA